MSRNVYPEAEGVPRLLALNQHGAAYNIDSADGRSAIYWRQFSTGRVQRITELGWQTQQIVVDDTWLAWVEQSQEQSDDLEPVSWRIKATRLGTGDVRTLFASKTKTRLAPGIGIWNDTLFHSQYNGIRRGTTNIHALDLRTSADTVIAEDVAADVGVYDGHNMISGMTTHRGSVPGQTRSDLFIVNHDPPTRLTTSGNVEGMALSNHVALWQECSATTSTCGIFTKPWPDGKTTLDLQADDPRPSLGDGFFTILQPSGGYYEQVVVPLRDPAKRFTLKEPAHQHLAFNPAVQDHTVAWFTSAGDDLAGPFHLVVARIE
ncbi:MAG TPA: hypothetical protein VFE15_00425 [Marmoricola sp.]|nr:hypothetical protein [Marmoricola sp.]